MYINKIKVLLLVFIHSVHSIDARHMEHIKMSSEEFLKIMY